MESQTVQAISAAVSALATVAILIATTLYVWYTRRLWEEQPRYREGERGWEPKRHLP